MKQNQNTLQNLFICQHKVEGKEKRQNSFTLITIILRSALSSDPCSGFDKYVIFVIKYNNYMFKFVSEISVTIVIVFIV